jgi:hypothetical protein
VRHWAQERAGAAGPERAGDFVVRSWLYLALAAILAIGIVSPRPAAAQVPLSYHVTLTGTSYSGARPSGSIAGTFGGVAVDGEYSGGAWTFAAYGRPFASGTYACVRICRFNGTILAGRAMVYTWTSQVPTWDARTQASAGQIGGLFFSRNDWSALVGTWAQANGLPPALQTRLIIDAQTGM